MRLFKEILYLFKIFVILSSLESSLYSINVKTRGCSTLVFRFMINSHSRFVYHMASKSRNCDRNQSLFIRSLVATIGLTRELFALRNSELYNGVAVVLNFAYSQD